MNSATDKLRPSPDSRTVRDRRIPLATGFAGAASSPTQFVVGEGGELEDMLVVSHSGIPGAAQPSDQARLAVS